MKSARRMCRLAALLVALAALAVSAGAAYAGDGKRGSKGDGDEKSQSYDHSSKANSDGDRDEGKGDDSERRSDTSKRSSCSNPCGSSVAADDDDNERERSDRKSRSNDDGDDDGEKSQRKSRSHEKSKSGSCSNPCAAKDDDNEKSREKSKEHEAKTTSGYIAYCYRDASGAWKLGYAKADDLAKKVEREDIVVPPFQVKGKWHSKKWNSEGQAIMERAKKQQSGKSDSEKEHKKSRSEDEQKGSYKDTSSGTDLKRGMKHKQTICHATGSTSNPYVVITPSVSGVFNGHLGHQGGEDIVPSFTYKGQSYSQNWDAAGQAMFASGCAAAGSEKGDEEDEGKDKDKDKGHCGPCQSPAPATCPAGMAAISDSSLTAVQGGTSTGTFTIAAGCSNLKVSLVSYSTPWATFNIDEAHLEKLFDSKTGVFGPGAHTLTVNTPNCFYQVDLVIGDVITVLGTNGLYGPQGRLIRAANGGSGPCVEAAAAAPTPTTTTTATAPVNAPAVTTAAAAPAPPAGEVLGAVAPAKAPAKAKAKAKAKAQAPAKAKPAGGVLGEVASAPEAIAATAASGELPFTGIPLWIAALVGGGILAMGLVLRRASARH